MKTPILFKEYIWLINTIYQARAISFSGINEKWVQTEMSGGIPMSRTTFNRHKDAIESIFGVYIECDRKNGYRYYIGNERVLREDTVQNWVLTSMSVGNIVGECVSIHNRILLESIPSVGGTLKSVLKAMKENRRISICYCRYGSFESNTFLIEPYCIKLFHQRWYLLGKMKNGRMAIFSFDRIVDLEIQSTKFTLSKDFDAAEYFDDSYGVVIGDGTKVERVVLRAYGLEKYAIRDLPIHHSQKEINTTEEYSDFELRIKSTSDFIAYLLSRGSWVIALSPQSLVDEIAELHKLAYDTYMKRKTCRLKNI